MIFVLKAGKLNEALDILMSLEKQTRAVSSSLCFQSLTLGYLLPDTPLFSTKL